MNSHAHCKLSDAALIAAWRRGDFAHVGALFLKYRRLVTWIGHRYRTDPDDLFQRTVVNAMAAHEQFHRESVKEFGAWFCVIANNIVRKDHKHSACRAKYLANLAYLLRTAPACWIPETDDDGEEWSRKDLEILRKEYPIYGVQYVVLKIGKPKPAVRIKAQALGLSTVAAVGNVRPWTEDEVRILRSTWLELGKAVVMSRLPGRSWKSIAFKAAKLGLVRGHPARSELRRTA